MIRLPEKGNLEYKKTDDLGLSISQIWSDSGPKNQIWPKPKSGILGRISLMGLLGLDGSHAGQVKWLGWDGFNHFSIVLASRPNQFFLTFWCNVGSALIRDSVRYGRCKDRRYGRFKERGRDRAMKGIEVVVMAWRREPSSFFQRCGNNLEVKLKMDFGMVWKRREGWWMKREVWHLLVKKKLWKSLHLNKLTFGFLSYQHPTLYSPIFQCPFGFFFFLYFFW